MDTEYDRRGSVMLAPIMSPTMKLMMLLVKSVLRCVK